MKLQELAEKLGCRLEGDGSVDIRRVASLDQAEPGDITFFANAKYAEALKRTRASAVIAGDDAPAGPWPVLRTKDPYLAFANALSHFIDMPRPAPGIDPLSSVAADAVVGREVSIGPFVTIGRGARIGAQAGVMRDVPSGVEVAGSPAQPKREFFRQVATLMRLARRQE